MGDKENTVWDAHSVRILCDICMEEVNANNRDGGCLSKKEVQES